MRAIPLRIPPRCTPQTDPNQAGPHRDPDPPLVRGPYVKLKIKKKMGVRHPAACGGWTLDFGE